MEPVGESRHILWKANHYFVFSLLQHIMFQIHIHIGYIRYTYTCIHEGTQMTKVKKTEPCTLHHGFSLSGLVVQVVLPNEVHVTLSVGWVLHGILHNRYSTCSHRHVCDVESWDGRIKDDGEMGKREGML